MDKKVSKQTRLEVVATLRQRYSLAGRQEKARILDEFVNFSQYHRKYAVRLLRRKNTVVKNPPNEISGHGAPIRSRTPVCKFLPTIFQTD